MLKYEININTLITNKIGFEAYFILYCIYKNDENLITEYIRNCKKIETDVFNKLEEKGYLNIRRKEENKDTIYFKHLNLEDKGKLLFEDLDKAKATNDEKFKDFRNNYPKSTKNGRKLHNNLGRCRTIYIDITKSISHDILCKCARLYILEKKKTNSEEYIQMLETWLHQKNYEQYIDELEYTVEEDHNNLDTV